MAKWIKLGTQIISHERFLAAGSAARDLYVWAMAHSGFHERDGFVSTVAIETSPWGAGSAKGNLKLAARLVEVGLWKAVEGGYQILKWTEQGNATAEDLKAKRETWSAEKQASRKREKKSLSEECPVRTDEGVRDGVPYSYSSSEESRSRDPDPAREGISVPHNDAPPCAVPTALVNAPDPERAPPWWPEACKTASADAIGGRPVDMPAARWREYVVSITKRHMAPDRTHAVTWLTKILRDEFSKGQHRIPREPQGGASARARVLLTGSDD